MIFPSFAIDCAASNMQSVKDCLGYSLYGIHSRGDLTLYINCVSCFLSISPVTDEKRYASEPASIHISFSNNIELFKLSKRSGLLLITQSFISELKSPVHHTNSFFIFCIHSKCYYFTSYYHSPSPRDSIVFHIHQRPHLYSRPLIHQ